MNQEVSTEPTFSVVIPVFNRAHMILETLQSVWDQTYQPLEVILVDDGSQDDLPAAVRDVADGRLRLVRQTNSGANVARNLGIDTARGSHVALLDSDDRFMPHHLERAADVIRGGHTGAVYAPIIVDRGDGLHFVKPPRAIRPREHMADYLLRDRGFVQTSTLVVPTSIARSVRYRKGMPFGQDTDFAIRLYHAGVGFVMIPHPTVVWRDHFDPTRVSSTVAPEAREEWLKEIRAVIPEKAYHADRGWFLAKAYARSGSRWRATWLCLTSVLRGCYPPRLAAAVTLQVLLSPRAYRWLSDTYLSTRATTD